MVAVRTHDGVPLLADGTPLTDLLDDDERSVAARALSDPEIHQLELDRIFGKCWQFVAHESELPGAGAYVTRWMGDDAVIVTRDADDNFHVLLNVCSHKGAAVCKSSQGRTMQFTCPYHGWMYHNTGAVASVFAEPILFPDDMLNKESLGLRAARVGVYAGFIFATWDDEVEPFDEYLGEFAWYLDLVFGLIGGGVEVLGPPVRWIIETNWKVACENLTGDSYHVATTHRSLFEIGLAEAGIDEIDKDAPRDTSDVNTEFNGVAVFDPDRGHGALCIAFLNFGNLERACPVFGIPASRADEVRERLSPVQLETLLGAPPIVGNVFPNFSFISSPFATEFDKPVKPVICIRTYLPRGPNQTEILTWPVVYRDAPQEMKDAVRKGTIRSFNTTGNFEQDDTEIWGTIGRMSNGRQGRRRRINLRGTVPVDTSWTGPLEAHKGPFTEDAEWNFYKVWRRLMTDGATEAER